MRLLLVEASNHEPLVRLHSGINYYSQCRQVKWYAIWPSDSLNPQLFIKFIMFNKEEVRQQIIQYFKSVGSGENIVQAIKQALFLNENFNPTLLFDMLSQGRQKITREDWRRYLIKRNIAFSEQELKYFFRHNHFGEEIVLNDFLEAMIPYNADVIRQFKSKYLDSLEVQELDIEVEFIFAELMSNWIGFFRTLIKIRSEISHNVSRKQIQHLVKEDLVLNSKPRQARKFHQAFQQAKFELSFHQLRKFLQLWVNSKDLLHEFCLLNVKRHIKCENPFEKIVYRGRKPGKDRSRSISGSRTVSKPKSISQARNRYGSTQKKTRANSKSTRKAYEQTGQNLVNKYEGYKRQLRQALENEIGRSHQNSSRKPNQSQFKASILLDKKTESAQKSSFRKDLKQENNFQNQALQRGLDSNGRNGSSAEPKKVRRQGRQQIIVKMFEQIIMKQERLEKIRKQLAKSSDFNLINLFKLIDSTNKGYINSVDLQTFTEGASVNYSDMVSFYAREPEKLRLQEFSMIFRPLSKQLNEILDKRPQHKVPNPFKRETNKLILQVIRLEAELQYNLKTLRIRISQQIPNKKGLFDYIDVDNQGYITSEAIRQLLDENNINCEPKDLKCLMKLFNKKVDERISYKQFLNFIDF